jgi:hypothetical protein
MLFVSLSSTCHIDDFLSLLFFLSFFFLKKKIKIKINDLTLFDVTLHIRVFMTCQMRLVVDDKQLVLTVK